MQTWAEPGRPVADPAASLTVDYSLVQTPGFCAGPNRKQPVDQRYPGDVWRDNQGLHRSGNTNPATSMETRHYHGGSSNDMPSFHRHSISLNGTAEHQQNMGLRTCGTETPPTFTLGGGCCCLDDPSSRSLDDDLHSCLHPL